MINLQINDRLNFYFVCDDSQTMNYLICDKDQQWPHLLHDKCKKKSPNLLW